MSDKTTQPFEYDTNSIQELRLILSSIQFLPQKGYVSLIARGNEPKYQAETPEAISYAKRCLNAGIVPFFRRAHTYDPRSNLFAPTTENWKMGIYDNVPFNSVVRKIEEADHELAARILSVLDGGESNIGKPNVLDYAIDPSMLGLERDREHYRADPVRTVTRGLDALQNDIFFRYLETVTENYELMGGSYHISEFDLLFREEERESGVLEVRMVTNTHHAFLIGERDEPMTSSLYEFMKRGMSSKGMDNDES